MSSEKSHGQHVGHDQHRQQYAGRSFAAEGAGQHRHGQNRNRPDARFQNAGDNGREDGQRPLRGKKGVSLQGLQKEGNIAGWFERAKMLYEKPWPGNCCFFAGRTVLTLPSPATIWYIIFPYIYPSPAPHLPGTAPGAGFKTDFYEYD